MTPLQKKKEKTIVSFLKKEPNSYVHLKSYMDFLIECKKFGKAVITGKKILKLYPDDLIIWMDFAYACLEADKLEDAKKAYQRAVALDPGNFLPQFGLARTLVQLTDFEDALPYFAAASEISPENASCQDHFRQCYAKAAYSARARGDVSKWETLSREGLERFPDDEELKLRHALSLLVQGKIAEGHRVKPRPESFFESPRPEHPVWVPGDPLQGTLLVRAEQGVGDQMLFFTLINELRARHDDLLIECDPRLIPLMQRTVPGVRLVAWNKPAHEDIFDPSIKAQTYMFDVCAYLRPDLAAFEKPVQSSPLVADSDAIAAYRKRFMKKEDDIVIGISWASTMTASASAKTIPLEELVRSFDAPGIRLVSLQYGDYAQEIRRVSRKLKRDIWLDPHMDPLGNLDDFAAAVSACDLVVSSSNATVHFSGALGVPTWCMINNMLNWHWFLRNEKSLWYPCVRLIRKPYAQKGWKDALAQMAGEVRCR